MGKISDKYKLGQGDKTEAKIIAVVNDVISDIPYVGAAWGVVWGLIQWIFESEVSIEKLLNDLRNVVEAGFENVAKDQEATDLHNTLMHINTQIGDAEGLMKAIYDSKNEPSDNVKAQMNNISHTEIETLNGFGYWNRPFFGDADAYNDGWNGKLYPETELVNNSQWVYDYRFILPAYLHLISYRMIIACIIKLDEGKYREEIGRYADKLLTDHERIRNSIVGLRAPLPCEIWGFWCWYGDHYIFWSSNWFGHSFVNGSKIDSRVCGAVELYSGLFSIEQYEDARLFYSPQRDESGMTLYTPPWLPQEPTHFDPPLSDDDDIYSYICLNNNYYYNKFLVKFAIRTLKHKRELYIRIGLHSLWNIINRLRILTEKPQLDKGINYSILSLLGAANEINSLVKGMGGAPLPNTISMSDIASRLDMTNSISLRKMLEEC